MIIGIGTDLVNIARIAQSLQRFADKFAQRLLTADELQLYSKYADPAPYLASRFAAKEATVKALGTGFTKGIWFNQIGTRHDAAGKPELYFLGAAHLLYQQKNIDAAHLTITHEKDYALAFVVLERG